MSSRQELTIDELFDIVVDLSDRERIDYLEKAGVSDEIRRSVLSLVRADAKSPRDASLYAAASELHVAKMLPAEFAADCLIGHDLGPYRVHDVIGIGGFGTVYQAFRRDHFEQRVAIKVVRADRSLKHEHRVRFEVERSVLARLEHPNIARLIDGGSTDDGRSYFVMEYIPGRPLSEYCEAEKLSIADRVKLFRCICDATAYAHRQGIVHRDLKSENILVLDGGTPKLIDFGIAKIVSDWNGESKQLTATGDSVLTPVYASPEQVGGDPITTASDVYALGVVLYELLTGCFPIEFESQQNVAHAILNRQPELPSQVLRHRRVDRREGKLDEILAGRSTSLSRLQRCLRGDLDRIVMMSLRKEPERRYRSAIEFHADIERYLEHRPIRARGDSIAYRTLRAMQRNHASVAVIFSILLTCLLMLLFGHVLIERARSQDTKLRSAIDRIQQSSVDQYFDAYVEVRRLLKERPDEPGLNELLNEFTAPANVRTTVENVKVWIRPAQRPLRPWHYVGATPLDAVRLPKANLQWRIQSEDGTEFTVLRRHYREGNFVFSFPHEHNAPDEMVKLTLGEDRTSWLPISGENRQVDGEIFFDKFEVSNLKFQRFVDAGGYEERNSPYWPTFVRDGKTIEFSEAVNEFRDQTGEFGPGNWRHGRFPPDHARYPVREVSWYEAMAYAKFARKRLPSVFHWSKAAAFNRSHSIVVMSNIQDSAESIAKQVHGSQASSQVQAVGSGAGFGVYGTLDMAGNVREWCFNATTDGRRYALGGSSRDVTYMYSYPEAMSPWERSPDTGFRCMSFAGELPGSLGDTLTSVELVTRDFSRIKPIWADDAFQSQKDHFDYDTSTLEFNITDDVVDGKPVKRIVFNAAYEGPMQYIAGALYLPDPRIYSPPYQTIIHFPGAYAMRGKFPPSCMYLLNGGRAVFQPDYWGTGSRIRTDFNSPQPSMDIKYQEAVSKIVMDFSRSIDVLEQIEQVDHGKLGYHGISWGAAIGPILLSIDNRCRAAVLMSGGLAQTNTRPIVDQVNYCPHVNCPVLMINGRHDAGIPPAAQKAMFDLFRIEKEWRLFESSHFPSLAVRQPNTVQWFDEHLGYIRPKTGP